MTVKLNLTYLKKFNLPKKKTKSKPNRFETFGINFISIEIKYTFTL